MTNQIRKAWPEDGFLKKRSDLIERINQILGLEENTTLEWTTLCQKTEFDSFYTALAFGLNWQDKSMETMPMANLKMALFNMVAFPKKVVPDAPINN